MLILATVMSFVAIARAFYSKGVTGQVVRSSLGIQAQTIAESAAEEALVELRRRVNDPEQPIYAELREEVYAGESSEFELGLDTPQLDRMYEQYPEISPFYLHERTAKVKFQKQFTAVPYERFGLIQVRTTVRRDLSLTSTVSRTVEQGVEFKVHLVSTPRPYDQTAVYVHEGAELLERPYQLIEDTLQSIEFRRSEHEDIVDMMDRRKDAVPFNGRAMLSRYEGIVVPESAYWREKVPLLRSPAALFALGRPPGGVSLEHLGIQEKIREAGEDVRRAEEALAESRDRLERDFEVIERHNDYLSKLRVTLGAYSEMIGRMESFRKLFQVWDGDKYSSLAPFAYKLEPREWRKKAGFVLDRSPDGDSPQQVLDRVLSQPQGAYGVFYTNWPTRTINLANKRIKGRVVLVAEATTVNLENVGPASEDDLLTVVSFGRVRVSGNVNASVMALGALDFAGDAKLEGNLVLNRVPSTTSGIGGHVTYDRKLHSGRTTSNDASGAKTQYYWVSVAPRPIYTSIGGGK